MRLHIDLFDNKEDEKKIIDFLEGKPKKYFFKLAMLDYISKLENHQPLNPGIVKVDTELDGGGLFRGWED